MGAQEGPQLLVLAGLLVFVLAWVRWHGYFPSPGEECDPEADEKAAALKRDVLSERELRQLAEYGYLVVPSPSVASRSYRVPGRPGWVEVYDGDRLDMRVCVEPVQHLPAADVVVMHKLMIEGNEDGYLRLANIVFVRPPAGQRWLRHHL